MFEPLTRPLIIIIISIVVFREFELPGMEYILTVFYAGFFVVLVMIVGMIKNKLLPLKRTPDGNPKPAIYSTRAIEY